jgi:hypothetical protein
MDHTEEFKEIERLTAKVSEQGLQSTFDVITFLGRKVNELSQRVEKLVAEKNGKKIN